MRINIAVETSNAGMKPFVALNFTNSFSARALTLVGGASRLSDRARKLSGSWSAVRLQSDGGHVAPEATAAVDVDELRPHQVAKAPKGDG